MTLPDTSRGGEGGVSPFDTRPWNCGEALSIALGNAGAGLQFLPVPRGSSHLIVKSQAGLG